MSLAPRRNASAQNLRNHHAIAGDMIQRVRVAIAVGSEMLEFNRAALCLRLLDNNQAVPLQDTVYICILYILHRNTINT